MPLVQTIGISKHYPSGKTIIRAISNVSLSIERGEFIAIRGRSGSGKSTLMNLLGLLERPDCGEYALEGREVVKLNEDIRASIRSQDIGFIFHQTARFTVDAYPDRTFSGQVGRPRRPQPSLAESTLRR